MKNLIIIVSFFIALEIYSKNNVTVGGSHSSKNPSLSTRGECVPGQSKTELNINNVRASLYNTGDMWWDRGTNRAKYGVPKLTIEQLGSGVPQVSPLFAGSIWISGEVSGNLVMAALEYSTNSRQFYPGPISLSQTVIDRKACSKFDQFWVVTGEDIENHIKGVSTSDAIRNWPGRSNRNLIGKKFSAQEYTNENLAPFCDVDGDGEYNADNGDFPSIKSTSIPANASFASQMIFWVVNDIGNAHSSPDANPMGIQLNCLAFAYLTSDELNNMTFYTYEIINKSNADIDETYMSQFVDCDLGNFGDDYVGCDTSRSMGFCVNGDAFDEATANATGYGLNVPIVAVDFFEGPRKDNGDLIGLSSFIYYQNGAGGVLSDPSTATDYRNNQEGKTKNGQNFTAGGNCTGGPIPTKFCFPGNPNSPVPEWSMCSAGLPTGDYRFVQNSGPFQMKPGQPEIISVGVIFTQPAPGSYIGCKIDLDKHLNTADEKAQRLFDFGFKNEVGPNAPTLEVFESNRRLDITLVNLPSSNNFGEKYAKGDINIPKSIIPGAIKDSVYSFEGYLVYQVKAPNAIGTFTDLLNPANAVLIKAMDLKNNVVYPKTRIEQSGVYFALDSLPFNNSGLEKQISVTEDKFESQGQKFLVNNKTYYFTAVAVAYNNYLDTLPAIDKRQTKQYKVSSDINIYSATPHDLNFYGIRTKAHIGQRLDVKRISGVGHGSYFLDVINGEEEAIVENNTKVDLTYIGGSAPVDVVVSDPYKLKNAKFKLSIKDSFGSTTNIFDKAKSYWELEIYEPPTSTSPIFVVSEASIERGNEQSIYTEMAGKLLSYGISVALSSNDSLGFAYRFDNLKPGSPSRKEITYKPIGSELKFKDSSKKWMTLLKNVPDADYTGWIKGGIKNEITATTPNVKLNSNSNFVAGKRVYTDSFNRYTNILEGRIAPYCLASNQYVTDPTNDANNYPAQGPAFKWRSLASERIIVAANAEGPENNLDQLYSVNIVFTNDRKMWSQCVVLETGDNPVYNEYNALKGQIRKSESLDTGFQPIGGDTGRSYFPGYAINLETGERVNVYFGENSAKRGLNAANMIWDPNDIVLTALGIPIMGNGHYVYVTNTIYDNGIADQTILLDNFNKVTNGSSTNPILDTTVAKVYRNIIWTFIPIGDTASWAKFYDKSGRYQIPNEARIKVRIEKPYALYSDNGTGVSEYLFSTDGLAPDLNVAAISDSSYNNMRIVPNPYNAYSVYEQSSIQNIVKFVGIPSGSSINIFTTDGILVRKIKLGASTADNYLGANTTAGDVNLDDSYSWDLRTTAGILISSGVYYVHVSTPSKGEKVLKLFATMRSVDVSNF